MSKTVLIVDDEALPLKLAKALLMREGLAVLALDSWAQVAQTLASNPVDLVLLDVNMPGLSGDTLAGIVKQSETGRKLPVILLSNLPESELAQRASEAGVDGWVQKPISGAAIQDLVRRFLRPGQPVAFGSE